MEYLSKTMRLDQEVVAWLDKLKEMHGSYNKGLRLVAFPGEGRANPAIDVTPKTLPTYVPPLAVGNCEEFSADLDAVASNDPTRGKASTETYRVPRGLGERRSGPPGHRPLREKGDRKR